MCSKYSSVPDDWRLDNGVRLNSSDQTYKEFSHASYDQSSRTFRGTIDWRLSPSGGLPTTWEGEAYLEYTCVFSEDFEEIEGGSVAYFSPEGEKMGAAPFGQAGQTMRRLGGYTPPEA